MSELDYYIYILTNWDNRVMYVGSTKDLRQRIKQHRRGNGAAFTKKYNVSKLVYFEKVADISEALQREKQLKAWRREWKNELVSSFNPRWSDLMDLF